ncbi:MAG: hypothetical protein WC755_07925 [Candidatus Woesearchaeota archaeon]|jgi:hypothetical protein
MLLETSGTTRKRPKIQSLGERLLSHPITRIAVGALLAQKIGCTEPIPPDDTSPTPSSEETATPITTPIPSPEETATPTPEELCHAAVEELAVSQDPCALEPDSIARAMDNFDLTQAGIITSDQLSQALCKLDNDMKVGIDSAFAGSEAKEISKNIFQATFAEFLSKLVDPESYSLLAGASDPTIVDEDVTICNTDCATGATVFKGGNENDPNSCGDGHLGVSTILNGGTLLISGAGIDSVTISLNCLDNIHCYLEAFARTNSSMVATARYEFGDCID